MSDASNAMRSRSAFAATLLTLAILVIIPPATAQLPGPSWARTWQLNRSTICMLGNTAGYVNASVAARWGLVAFDWTTANQIWSPPNVSANGTPCGAVLVEQCRRVKAVDPTTKCMVYRNAELALGWLEPQRAVMDAGHNGWFLQYQTGNPVGMPAGAVYNESAVVYNAFQQVYFWK